MSAGQDRPGLTDSTASWLEPESNQTSRMFISRSKLEPPHFEQTIPGGRNSSVGRSYQASAPYCSNTLAARSTSAGVKCASPHAVQSTAGIGTPQTRWREMHQSGRFASMLKILSCPHDGIHLTW